MKVTKRDSFHLLTEYRSFLLKKMLNCSNHVLGFPSPYGVIFILTRLNKIIGGIKNVRKVSVSLRSIIHSYAMGLFQ